MLYAKGGSGIYYSIPVKTKLFAAALFLLGLIIAANLAVLILNVIFLLVFSYLGGGRTLLLKRLTSFFLFALFIIVFHSLLNPANETYWFYFGREGFIYGSIVAVRLIGIVIIMQTFLITTPPGHIFQAFSSWHPDLGMIMLLLIGLLPIMREEMEMTSQAQQTRGISWGNFKEKLFAYLALLIPVIIKSLFRAQQMSYLLYLRGYSGARLHYELEPAWAKGFRWLIILSGLFFGINFFAQLIH